MPRNNTPVTWMYARLLKLYPRAFHREFASEMQADFADALDAAAQRGHATSLAFLAREGAGIIGGALAERWRENTMRTNSEAVTGWKGAAFALIPFALLVLISVSNAVKFLLPEWVASCILGLVGLVILLGLARGLPDWSLPSVGMAFGILGLFSIGYAYRVLAPVYQLNPSPVWHNILDGGVLWWVFPVLVPLLVAITALVKPWRPFYARVRADWTVLSFALYGSVPIALVITFDEYRGEEGFVIAAAAALMMGALVFLRRPTHAWRFAALGGGILISLGIAAVGKFLLMPTQEWAWRATTEFAQISQFNETFYTIVSFGWAMVMILLIPALVGLFLTGMNQRMRLGA